MFTWVGGPNIAPDAWTYDATDSYVFRCEDTCAWPPYEQALLITKFTEITDIFSRLKHGTYYTRLGSCVDSQ